MSLLNQQAATEHDFKLLNIVGNKIIGMTENRTALLKNCSTEAKSLFEQANTFGYKTGDVVYVKQHNEQHVVEDKLNTDDFTDEEKIAFIDRTLPVELEHTLTSVAEYELLETAYQVGTAWGGGNGVQAASLTQGLNRQMQSIAKPFAEKIETNIANQYYQFSNLISYAEEAVPYASLSKIGGSAATDPAYTAYARQDSTRIVSLLDGLGIDPSRLKVYLDNANLASLSDYFTTLENTDFYRSVETKGFVLENFMRMVEVGGMMIGQSRHIAKHTTGNYDPAVVPTLDTSADTWDPTITAHKNSRTQKITLDNCQVLAATPAVDSKYLFLAKGDIISPKGVYHSRNQKGEYSEDKGSIDVPYTWSVVKDVYLTAAGSVQNDIEVEVTYPIFESGAYQNVYVDGGTIANATECRIYGAPGVSRKEPMTFGPEAITCLMFPLAFAGGAGVNTTVVTGIDGMGLRLSTAATFNKLGSHIRFDSVYGISALGTQQYGIRRPTSIGTITSNENE